MKEKYQFIIVILVYRNIRDLEECIQSIRKKIKNNKVIVVNSYYDETSKFDAEKIAERYDCVFINVENRGYSYGNNVGIAYANEHYSYRYIIVSNPDIVIKAFPEKTGTIPGDIIAPQIIAANGKKQNPMLVRECRLAEKFIYEGFKRNRKLSVIAGIGLNKISRCLFFGLSKIEKKKYYQIYGAHGSFVILSRRAVETIGLPVYDENMFLFAEESVLAVKAGRAGLKTVYVPAIRIYHKEDGSMKLGNISVNDELGKANIYYYENYRLKK